MGGFPALVLLTLPILCGPVNAHRATLHVERPHMPSGVRVRPALSRNWRRGLVCVSADGSFLLIAASKSARFDCR
jgi:hypothetical protein